MGNCRGWVATFGTSTFAGFCLLACTAPVHAEQIDIAGPPGSVAFGAVVTVLPNGNIVVTDPDASDVAPKAGAVHLYTPDGTQISRLTGAAAGDRVGSAGVKVLANGNFLVLSAGGSAMETGVVTWINGDTGLSGVVSASNSLIGATIDVFGDINVVLLGNGNYVVVSPNWKNGAAEDAGAVTWANGATGLSGTISSANSLVGEAQNDCVGGDCAFGFGSVVASPAGNYVVVSPDWNNGAMAATGAITWVNGRAGLAGKVSSSNSLVGSSTNDRVGSGYYVGVLADGHFVVASPDWNNGSATKAGAVTWIDGAVGGAGVVSGANSLVGATSDSQVGSNGIVALNNGNYVVASPEWGTGPLQEGLGAVTWANGAQGLSGVVSPANSLVGKTRGDQVGSRVVALSNGNYVVASSHWNLGEWIESGNGAVTWVDGRTGLAGEVSVSNSLIGRQNDGIGSRGVVALSNGNYVVVSPEWGDGAWPMPLFGAVTWGDGTSGMTGVVSPANSLVGDREGDQIGRPGLAGQGVTALANGNYVVESQAWNDGVGAVTWGDGRVGTTGAVTTDNSLTGTTPICRITPLANGHFVVANPYWSSATLSSIGAVTWGNGDRGLMGTISADNSLFGATAGDLAGSGGVIALSNGHYVVSTPDWSNGAVSSAGAVTWGNGSAGAVGVISTGNSLVGAVSLHGIARSWTAALSDDSYLIMSAAWNNGGAVNAGALTLASSRFRQTGTLDASNSVLGAMPGGGARMRYAYDEARDRLIVGRPADNLVSLFTRDQIFADSFQ